MTERFDEWKGFRADPLSPINMAEHTSKVRMTCGIYEADDLAADTPINMGKIPQHARVIAFEIWHDALGAGVTLRAGTVSADNLFITDTAASAAGRIVMNNMNGFLNRDDTQDRCIVVVPKGAAATGTIKAAILYALE